MILKLNIQPIHIEGLNCYEDLIVSLSHWKVGQYAMNFVDSWGFSFDKSKDTGILGDKIGSGYKSIQTNADEYYNIRLNIHENPVQEELPFIKKELQEGHPVFLSMDTFYCHWQKTYKIRHERHCCMLLGFNEDGSFICIDAQPVRSNVILPYEDLVNGYINCLLLESKDCEVNNADVLRIFTQLSHIANLL